MSEAINAVAERNAQAIQSARAGNVDDPESLLESFLGRGPAFHLAGDRGLIDSHRRRAEHLGQFFTPLPVVRFIHEMLAIERAPAPTVADLSGCGSGRMFWGLQESAHCIGVEVDPDALDVAKAVFPRANLVLDSLVNRREQDVADYVLGNPPFSDWITQRDLMFELARWGSLGPRSSIRSDIAAVELAMRAVRPGGFVAMIWPDEVNDGRGDPLERSGDEHTRSLAKWVSTRASPIFRVHLGPSVFRPSGTEWRTCVLAWQRTAGLFTRWLHPPFEATAETADDLDRVLDDWRTTPSYRTSETWKSDVCGYAEFCDSGKSPIIIEASSPKTEPESLEPAEPLSIASPPDRVRIGYDAADDTLTIAHDGGVASALRLREWRNYWGRINLSHREDTERQGWQYVLRARNFYGAPVLPNNRYESIYIPVSLEDLRLHLAGFGLQAEFDVGLTEALEARRLWLKLHQIPLEQVVPTRDWLAMYASKHGKSFCWDTSDSATTRASRWINIGVNDVYEWLSMAPEARGEHEKHGYISALVQQACVSWGVPFERAATESWVELHETDGVRAQRSQEYARQVETVRRVAAQYGLPPQPFSLYPYQVDDVARFSLRDHNISYHEQATGKALILTLLALVYRDRQPDLKTLIVTESRLIEEFTRASFSSKQLPRLMRRIDRVSDFDRSCIWLMSYDQVWRTPRGETKTWAQLALDRELGFLACDEAHTLSSKNTNRTAELRSLAERVPKRILASGTMIPSVPRNAVSTWTTAYGDNTPLNKWGYRWPIVENVGEGPDGVVHLGGKSQTRVFGDMYVSVKWLTPQFIQTLSQGAHGREMPALKDENLENWQRWMSTTIIRRRASEPDIEPYARIIEPDIEELTIEPTIHHAAMIDYYTRVAYEAFVSEQEEQGKQPCLLPILKNVLFAGTVPQSPVVNRIDTPYREGLTTKQKLAVELVQREVALGKKVMLATERPDLCEIMAKHFHRDLGIKASVFTGRQTISDRDEILTQMEADPEVKVMLATTGTGGIGLNLPYIGAIVCVDYGWKDSTVAQLARRICRPAFRSYYPDSTPKVYLLALAGSLDPYQRQVCRVKFSAKAEAIDHLYQDEESEFMTWRDMIYQFFQDKGYDMQMLAGERAA